jgi:hypothetical protein
MPFPEKLPFTTWAVGLAAAFQAAESSASFKTACAWGLVILAAAVETIFLVWKPAIWRGLAIIWRGLAIVVVFLVVVLGVAVPAYRKEFLTGDLRVNFSVLHPAQLGTEKLDLGFDILNKSVGPVVIEDIFAVQIATTDFSNNPHRNIELCKIQGLYPLGRNIIEAWPHPNQKVLHTSMNKPVLPYPEKTFGYEGQLPFQDDGKLDIAVYNPKTLLESGKDVAIGALGVEAGKAISVVASFDTDVAAWDTHNVVVVCGAINYLGTDGHAASAVCPVTVVAHVYRDGKPFGTLVGPGRSAPYTITAGSNDGLCDVQRGL